MNDSPVTPSLRPVLNIEHGDAASLSAPQAGYGEFLLEIKSHIRQRQFLAFNEYADKPKLQPLVREISWV